MASSVQATGLCRGRTVEAMVLVMEGTWSSRVGSTRINISTSRHRCSSSEIIWRNSSSNITDSSHILSVQSLRHPRSQLIIHLLRLPPHDRRLLFYLQRRRRSTQVRLLTPTLTPSPRDLLQTRLPLHRQRQTTPRYLVALARTPHPMNFHHLPPTSIGLSSVCSSGSLLITFPKSGKPLFNDSTCMAHYSST